MEDVKAIIVYDHRNFGKNSILIMHLSFIVTVKMQNRLSFLMAGPSPTTCMLQRMSWTKGSLGHKNLVLSRSLWKWKILQDCFVRTKIRPNVFFRSEFSLKENIRDFVCVWQEQFIFRSQTSPNSEASIQWDRTTSRFFGLKDWHYHRIRGNFVC